MTMLLELLLFIIRVQILQKVVVLSLMYPPNEIFHVMLIRSVQMTGWHLGFLGIPEDTLQLLGDVHEQVQVHHGRLKCCVLNF